MKKIVLTYGFISGLISALLMVIVSLSLKNIGFDKGELLGYSSMVLSFIIIYPAVVSYRNNVGSGTITFGRAFSIGLLITLISCVFYVIAWTVMYKTVFPDFADKYGAYVIEKMRAKGAAQADIDRQVKQMQEFKEMYKNPVIMSLLTFIEPLPVGLVISLIAAAIARRGKKTASA